MTDRAMVAIGKVELGALERVEVEEEQGRGNGQ